MEKEASITLGEKIVELLRKDEGKNFTATYKNGGSITILIVECINSKVAGRIKTILWNRYRISGAKINGTKNIDETINISLCDLSHDSVGLVEVDFKKMFPGGLPPKKHDENTSAGEPEIVPPIEIKPKHFGKGRTPKTDIAKCRLAITLYLSHISTFEMEFNKSVQDLKDLFSYEKIDDLGMQILRCESVHVAKEIEQAVRFLVGSDDAVARTDDSVLVDFSKMIARGKRPTGGTYCLAPIILADRNEIIARLNRVNYNATPEVTEFASGFVATYSRNSMAQKIQDLVCRMGWRTMVEDKKLFIYVDPNVPIPEQTKDQGSDTPSEISQDSGSKPGIKPEAAPNHKEEGKTLDLTQQSNQAPSSVSLFVTSKEEALVELERLYFDSALYAQISPETQQRIASVLKERLRTKDPQKFAESLLAFYEK